MNQDAKKRVLFILGWYYPDSVGGTENYVSLLAGDLKTLGWEPFILAPSEDEKERNYIHQGIPVYRYPIKVNAGRDEIRGNIEPWEFEYFKNKVLEISPDLVNMNTYNRACGNYHANFIKARGIPLVLTIHVPEVTCMRGTMMRWGSVQCDGEMVLKRCTACMINKYGIQQSVASLMSNIPLTFAKAASGIESKLGTALSMPVIINTRIKRVKQLLTSADSIVTVSQWLKDVLILNGVPEEKITCILKGLPEDWHNIAHEIENHRNNDVFRLAYIGRFSEVKGLHILIESVIRLKNTEKFELQIYGRVNDKESSLYYKSLQKRAHGYDFIKFKGELTEDNRNQVFSNIDMIACPSIWFENLPYVISEAFAARIPVLASDVKGISEQVFHKVNGILVEPDNIGEWHIAIQNILNDRSILEQLKSGIPGVRRNIDSSEETLDLFERVLHDHTH